MGQPITCGRNKNKSMLITPKLQEVDIQRFYNELKTNPAFNGRFETVPLSRILLMANEILVFLAYVIRNGRSPNEIRSCETCLEQRHRALYPR